MEETLEGGRGPLRAVAPLERERVVMRADRRTNRRYVKTNRRGFASYRREGCSKPVSVVRAGKLWVCSMQLKRVFGPGFDPASPAPPSFFFVSLRLYAVCRIVNTFCLLEAVATGLTAFLYFFLRTLCFDHRVYFCGFYDS
jgi:hypothetical protein